MLKTLQILFGIISFAFAFYGLMTKNYEHNGLMILFLGFMMLVIGIQEIQKNNKIFGLFFILIFGFSIFSSIQSFIYIR